MTQTNIVIKCTNRGDHWSSEVLERVKNVSLRSVNARYHRRCFALFFTSSKFGTHKRGRPTSTDITESMEQVYNYLEKHEDSQHTLKEIKCFLNILHIDERTITRKLKERYGDNIIITSHRGKKINYVLLLHATTNYKRVGTLTDTPTHTLNNCDWCRLQQL